MSVGVSEYPTHGDTPNALIGAADAALYRAKEGGRDQVVAARITTGKRAKKEPVAKRRPAKKKAAKKSPPKKHATPTAES